MKNIIIFTVFYCSLKSGTSSPLGDFGGSASIDTTIVKTPLSHLGEVTNQKVQQLILPKAFSIVPPFPDSGRQKAVLEQESIDSAIKTKYGNLQEFVGRFFNPQPVVDSISEHEKYGNDGNKHRAVAVGVVSIVEGASNLINTAADLPFQVAQQVGNKITTSLNSVGGKLVGLS